MARRKPLVPKKKKSNKPKKMKTLPILILIVVVAGAVGTYFVMQPGEVQDFPEFAECLVDAQATMYGTERCLFCQKQKREIGNDAFKQFFTETGFYVQCDMNTKLGDTSALIGTDRPLAIGPETTMIQACLEMEIDKTPTWVINGERFIGLINIPKLAELTGCEIPEGYAGDLEPTVGGHTG